MEKVRNFFFAWSAIANELLDGFLPRGGLTVHPSTVDRHRNRMTGLELSPRS